MRTRSLILLLMLLSLAVFTALRAPDWWAPKAETGQVARIELSRSDAREVLPSVAGNKGGPLVVIDAGHGGHDPGATGQGYREKTIVLELAHALRNELEKEGHVRVALTRDEDRYLVHAERVAIARKLDADLFISLHADSAGEASDVTGASIYTLSNRASSQAAARFAERENATDRLNGVNVGGQSDAVSTILVELSQRRTQQKSDEFARLILREGEGDIRFHPQPRRSAALKVLRAPDVPSILFESGFISNEADAQRLASEEGRARFAEVMARAIRIYFARQQES